MPGTNCVWMYDGGEDEKLKGEQRAQAGDDLFDDVYGGCTLELLDGAFVHLKIKQDGELKKRTAGHVRAVTNRAAKPSRARGESSIYTRVAFCVHTIFVHTLITVFISFNECVKLTKSCMTARAAV